MARPSQRACLLVTESDDVFGLECDNEIRAIAPNGYSPAKRVKSPSERVLAKHCATQFTEAVPHGNSSGRRVAASVLRYPQNLIATRAAGSGGASKGESQSRH